MRYLIKKAKIVTPEGSSQRKDILIVNGKIKEISKSIEDAKATLIESKNLHVSIGFCDIGTQIGEPGYEERETIESVTRAAANGGYTRLVPFPNVNPVVDTKSSIRFIKSSFSDGIISAEPLGAVSKGCEGKDIAEMLDMHHHGAVAFSDGNKSIQDTGLLLRALQYSKAIKSIVIQHPNDAGLSSGSMMHEGIVSTSLGMTGSPEEAEVIMVKRDIDLAIYADAPLCLHNLSVAESVNLIKNAKSDQLFASVSAMNLIHTDEDLKTFNPVYKVKPVLRSKRDKSALIRGINNDHIDYISSNHVPKDPESKDLEFFRSAYGASTLDTVFSSLLTYVGDQIAIHKLVEKLAYGSRKVLDLAIPKIEVDKEAELCVFDPSTKWTVNQSNILSKSKNNPYIGRELQGKILATFNNNYVQLNK